MKEKKFDLLGTDYIIKELKEIPVDNPDQYRTGETSGLHRYIYVAKEARGVTIDDRRKRISLLHELFHAFLDEGQYSELSNNEPLVEWLARCTNAGLEQGIIKI